ncbi:hypothetical protein E4K10_30325 [Streptomyces sp. T1317-0309]|nr:hypothetical protein E4K10_30325 [Streptomyces sp. T1317-0309]
MRPTQDNIRAICATAATFLPDTDDLAAPRELICVVDAAIERRYEDEHLSTWSSAGSGKPPSRL